MIIDAHQHFWDLKHSDVFDHAWLEVPEHGVIHRSFLPGDLRPLLDKAGVERCVFVQTQHHLEETRWAFTLAEHHDWMAGVVGWVDLASPACVEQVAEFKKHPKFCGVRHITQGEPDEDFVLRQAPTADCGFSKSRGCRSICFSTSSICGTRPRLDVQAQQPLPALLNRLS